VLFDAAVSAECFDEHLRQKIRQQTQCTASVGMGPNILLARLATKEAKPNGSRLVLSSEGQTFMESVQIRDLPGVGKDKSRFFLLLEYL